MTLSESTINKINLFVKNGELHFDLDELKELQKYCRQTFRFSVDINCSSCVANHAKRVHQHLNKKT